MLKFCNEISSGFRLSENQCESDVHILRCPWVKVATILPPRPCFTLYTLFQKALDSCKYCNHILFIFPHNRRYLMRTAFVLASHKLKVDLIRTTQKRRGMTNSAKILLGHQLVLKFPRQLQHLKDCNL